MPLLPLTFSFPQNLGKTSVMLMLSMNSTHQLAVNFDVDTEKLLLSLFLEIYDDETILKTLSEI